MKQKKRLTHAEEFEVLKLVLDKILWLGFIVMAYGLWVIVTKQFQEGITWIITGAIILIIFVIFILREFEIIR